MSEMPTASSHPRPHATDLPMMPKVQLLAAKIADAARDVRDGFRFNVEILGTAHNAAGRMFVALSEFLPEDLARTLATEFGREVALHPDATSPGQVFAMQLQSIDIKAGDALPVAGGGITRAVSFPAGSQHSPRANLGPHEVMPFCTSWAHNALLFTAHTTAAQEIDQQENARIFDQPQLDRLKLLQVKMKNQAQAATAQDLTAQVGLLSVLGSQLAAYQQALNSGKSKEELSALSTGLRDQSRSLADQLGTDALRVSGQLGASFLAGIKELRAIGALAEKQQPKITASPRMAATAAATLNQARTSGIVVPLHTRPAVAPQTTNRLTPTQASPLGRGAIGRAALTSLAKTAQAAKAETKNSPVPMGKAPIAAAAGQKAAAAAAQTTQTDKTTIEPKSAANAKSVAAVVADAKTPAATTAVASGLTVAQPVAKAAEATKAGITADGKATPAAAKTGAAPNISDGAKTPAAIAPVTSTEGKTAPAAVIAKAPAAGEAKAAATATASAQPAAKATDAKATATPGTDAKTATIVNKPADPKPAATASGAGESVKTQTAAPAAANAATHAVPTNAQAKAPTATGVESKPGATAPASVQSAAKATDVKATAGVDGTAAVAANKATASKPAVAAANPAESVKAQTAAPASTPENRASSTQSTAKTQATAVNQADGPVAYAERIIAPSHGTAAQNQTLSATRTAEGGKTAPATAGTGQAAPRHNDAATPTGNNRPDAIVTGGGSVEQARVASPAPLSVETIGKGLPEARFTATDPVATRAVSTEPLPNANKTGAALTGAGTGALRSDVESAKAPVEIRPAMVDRTPAEQPPVPPSPSKIPDHVIPIIEAAPPPAAEALKVREPANAPPTGQVVLEPSTPPPAPEAAKAPTEPKPQPADPVLAQPETIRSAEDTTAKAPVQPSVVPIEVKKSGEPVSPTETTGKTEDSDKNKKGEKVEAKERDRDLQIETDEKNEKSNHPDTKPVELPKQEAIVTPIIVAPVENKDKDKEDKDKKKEFKAAGEEGCDPNCDRKKGCCGPDENGKVRVVDFMPEVPQDQRLRQKEYAPAPAH